MLNNRQYYFLDNLKPGVFFNVTIKQFKDNCPYYSYAYIKTNPWGLDLASMAQSKYVFINGPRCDKTCLRGVANNKGAEQPAHLRSLISPLVIRLLESFISKLASSKISIF